MGKIKFKKPDIKGCFGKLKSLKWADVKNGIRAMKKRQAEKEAAYRNSRFAQKMQKLYPYMNRYSLILHGIWAIAINFLIEAMSRHSGGGRAGPESRSPQRGRKERGNDPCGGYQQGHRLCAGRLQPGGHEKAVPHRL